MRSYPLYPNPTSQSLLSKSQTGQTAQIPLLSSSPQGFLEYILPVSICPSYNLFWWLPNSHTPILPPYLRQSPKHACISSQNFLNPSDHWQGQAAITFVILYFVRKWSSGKHFYGLGYRVEGERHLMTRFGKARYPDLSNGIRSDCLFWFCVREGVIP